MKPFEDEHQAVMRLFHNTGRTALQVDEIIRLAVPPGGRCWSGGWRVLS